MLEFIKVMTSDKYRPKIWNKNKLYESGITPCIGLYENASKSTLGGQKALDFKISLSWAPLEPKKGFIEKVGSQDKKAQKNDQT